MMDIVKMMRFVAILEIKCLVSLARKCPKRRRERKHEERENQLYN
jgi:hypothetical protein